MTENEIARICVDAIYAVYKGLGPGLLESIYQKVLLYELKKRGLEAVSELKIPIHYDGLVFGTELRADIVVGNNGANNLTARSQRVELRTAGLGLCCHICVVLYFRIKHFLSIV